MGEIVGAAIVSHHPGIMRPKADRLKLGDGNDTDLIPGFGRVREAPGFAGHRLNYGGARSPRSPAPHHRSGFPQLRWIKQPDSLDLRRLDRHGPAGVPQRSPALRSAAAPCAYAS